MSFFGNLIDKINDWTLQACDDIEDPGTVLGIATETNFEAMNHVFYWTIFFYIILFTMCRRIIIDEIAL